MDKREEYMDGVRLYSDVLDGEAKEPKKQVEYYKKVQKTTSRTIVKEGNKPGQQRVVSTTIIKNGNNPEQVSKKIISSKNYGNSSYEERSRRFGDWGKNNSGCAKAYQVSRRFETSSNKKYTGLQPSSQAVNVSSKYNSQTSSQGYKKYVASSTSRKNNYSSSTGKVPSSLKYGPGVKINQTYSSGNQDKYSFAGTLKEKDNYTYYVSGIGYVNKDGEPLDKSKAALMKKSKTVPKPVVTVMKG